MSDLSERLDQILYGKKAATQKPASNDLVSRLDQILYGTGTTVLPSGGTRTVTKEGTVIERPPANEPETVIASVPWSPPQPQPQQPREVRKPRKYEGFFDELGRSLMQGLLSTASSLSQTAANVSQGAIWGPDQLQEWSDKLYEMSNLPKYQPAKAKTKSDKVKAYLAQVIGSTIPYSAASMLAGVVGGPFAAFGVTASVEGEQIYRQAKADGATENEAQLARFLHGIIAGAIEQKQFKTLERYIKGDKGTLTSKAVQKAIEKLKSPKLQKHAKSALELVATAATEGLQEALQQESQIDVLKAIGDKKAPSGWEHAKQVLGAGLGGAVMGGTFGLAGKAAAKTAQTIDEKLTQAKQAKAEKLSREALGAQLGLKGEAAKRMFAMLPELQQREAEAMQQEYQPKEKTADIRKQLEERIKAEQAQRAKAEGMESKAAGKVFKELPQLQQRKKEQLAEQYQPKKAKQTNIKKEFEQQRQLKEKQAAKQKQAERRAKEEEEFRKTKLIDLKNKHIALYQRYQREMVDSPLAAAKTAKEIVKTIKQINRKLGQKNFDKGGKYIGRPFVPPELKQLQKTKQTRTEQTILQQKEKISKRLTNEEQAIVSPEIAQKPAQAAKTEQGRIAIQATEKAVSGRPAQRESKLKPTPIQEGQEVRSELEKLPVVEVPVEKIKLSKEVMQFKEGADEKTGVVRGEELKGKYSRFPLNPIVIWRRKNGNLEVITGRHRLDLARRSGEKTIPAQIVEESKGFTSAMAKVIDAESNIRDGQGKASDYAKYFRGAKLSKQEAESRGLLSRSKGRIGYAIGTGAIDDVFYQFTDGRLSEAKAYAIASVAPNNERVQRAALAQADNLSPGELETYARILLHTEPSDAKKATQGNLFGWDESALHEAELVAKEVEKERKRIKEKILAVKGALKRPEAAKKMGLRFTSEEQIREEVKRLENRLDDLTRVQTTPELYKEFRRRAGLKSKEEKAAPAGMEKNLLGQYEVTSGTGGKQQGLGFTFEKKAKEAKVKDSLVKAVTNLYVKQNVTNAKDIAAELASKKELFNNPSNIMPEIETALEDAKKGKRLFRAGQSAAAVVSEPKAKEKPVKTSLKGYTYEDYKNDVKSDEFRSSWPEPKQVKLMDEVFALISPASVSTAKTGRNILRYSLGELQRAYRVVEEHLKKARKAFSKLSRETNYEFIDRMERGKAQPTRELDQFARQMRKVLDDLADQIRALGKGYLEEFYVNYFPHIWKNPKAAKDVFTQIVFGKRRLEGSKSFLKRRLHIYFVDGLEAGLEPISDNPVDLVLLKAYEMQKFIEAHKIKERFKKSGLAKFKYARAKMPAGYKSVNDPAFKVYTPPEITIPEAYDALFVDQLMTIADRLGIDVKRKANLGGHKSVWGYAVRNPEKVRTKFASTEQVLTHEIGHILGYRYNLFDRLTRKGEKVLRQITRGPNKGKLVEEYPKEIREYRRKIKKQWDAIVNLRFEGVEVPESFKKYARNRREKEAVLLQAFLHIPEQFKKIAPDLYKAFEDFLRETPELRDLLEVRQSLVLGQSEAKVKVPGLNLLGEWVLPEGTARLLNNYLSPGLRNNENLIVRTVYNSIRTAQNTIDAVSLGVSLFHARNILIDCYQMSLNRLIRDIQLGHYDKFIQHALALPVAIGEAIVKGIQLKKMYLQDMEQLSPEARSMVQAVLMAGARDRMSAQYTITGFNTVQKTIRDILYGTTKDKALGAAKLPVQVSLALVRATAKPILEWLVPHAKLGAFYMFAEQELRNVAEHPEEMKFLQDRLIQAWDAIENTQGEMTYDNLFWHKTFKDLGMLIWRLGWNLGTIRTVTSAAYDTATIHKRIKAGDRILTINMLQIMSMVLVYGIYGAIKQYLMTGEPPKELKDYFFPKTGKLNPDGSPERISMPTYAKDYYSYFTQPAKTFVNKLHPFWHTVYELTTNKDFFNVQIRNPRDPITKQAVEVAKYIGEQFIPLSVKNYYKMRRTAPERVKQNLITSLTGETSAPAYVSRTAAQKLMYRYIFDSISRTPRTRKQFERSQYRKMLIAKLRAGIAVSKKEAIERLGVKGLRRAVKEAKADPFELSYKKLTLRQAMNVYNIATVPERKKIANILLLKFARKKDKTEEEIQQMKALVNEEPEKILKRIITAGKRPLPQLNSAEK